MIRQLATAVAATCSMAACAGPMVADTASAPEGLVVLSLTADVPADARISSLEYRIRPVTPMGDGELQARTQRRSSSVNEQFRRAAQDNARRAADNLRSRLSVLGHDVPAEAGISEADKTVGRVVVLHLPPGEYELREWSMSMREGGDMVTVRAPAQSAYRFSVSGGEQRYVGNIHLSFKPASRFSQTLSDARERDLELARPLDPAVRVGSLVYAPAERVR